MATNYQTSLTIKKFFCYPQDSFMYRILDRNGNEKFRIHESGYFLRKFSIFDQKNSKNPIFKIAPIKKGLFNFGPQTIFDQVGKAIATISGEFIVRDTSGKIILEAHNDQVGWKKIFRESYSIFSVHHNKKIGNVSMGGRFEYSMQEECDERFVLALGISIFTRYPDSSSG